MIQRVCGGCALLLILLGCTSPKTTPTENVENLRKVEEAYRAAIAKLSRPPKDESEFKPFLAKIGDPDKLLRSTNDNQPFVILYGADPRRGMELKPLVIAYEKEGRAGKRSVYTAMGVMEMSDEDFREANFPSGHKPK